MPRRRYILAIVTAVLLSSISWLAPALYPPRRQQQQQQLQQQQQKTAQGEEEGEEEEEEEQEEQQEQQLLQSTAMHITDLRGVVHPQEPWNAVVSDFLVTSSQHKAKRKARRKCHAQYLEANSHCPTWDWLRRYKAPIEEKRAAVFVDIGCNKGYSSASFFEQFAPESALNLKALCREHRDIGTRKWFGVCRDCYETRTIRSPDAPSIRPRVYCIDANPNAHNRTKFCANKLQKDDTLAQGWELFLLGMSNRTGIMSYEICGNKEDCGMCRVGEERRSQKCFDINVTSYDKFAQDHGIGFADLVKLDTEGEEPMIIQGMHNALASKNVGFLAFEVHGSGKGWYGKFDMSRIVDLMSAYGYVCYMDAGPEGRLQLLTGCSWSARFRNSYTYQNRNVTDTLKIPRWYRSGVVPQWGNAICGLESHQEIREILRSLSRR